MHSLCLTPTHSRRPVAKAAHNAEPHTQQHLSTQKEGINSPTRAPSRDVSQAPMWWVVMAADRMNA